MLRQYYEEECDFELVSEYDVAEETKIHQISRFGGCERTCFVDLIDPRSKAMTPFFTMEPNERIKDFTYRLKKMSKLKLRPGSDADSLDIHCTQMKEADLPTLYRGLSRTNTDNSGKSAVVLVPIATSSKPVLAEIDTEAMDTAGINYYALNSAIPTPWSTQYLENHCVSIHIAAHGEYGKILIPNRYGKKEDEYLDAGGWANEIWGFDKKKRIRLVVLSCCSGADTADQMAPFADFVIHSPARISEESLLYFNSAFYFFLALHSPITDAFDSAKSVLVAQLKLTADEVDKMFVITVHPEADKSSTLSDVSFRSARVRKHTTVDNSPTVQKAELETKKSAVAQPGSTSTQFTETVCNAFLSEVGEVPDIASRLMARVSSENDIAVLLRCLTPSLTNYDTLEMTVQTTYEQLLKEIAARSPIQIVTLFLDPVTQFLQQKFRRQKDLIRRILTLPEVFQHLDQGVRDFVMTTLATSVDVVLVERFESLLPQYPSYSEKYIAALQSVSFNNYACDSHWILDPPVPNERPVVPSLKYLYPCLVYWLRQSWQKGSNAAAKYISSWGSQSDFFDSLSVKDRETLGELLVDASENSSRTARGILMYFQLEDPSIILGIFRGLCEHSSVFLLQFFDYPSVLCCADDIHSEILLMQSRGLRINRKMFGQPVQSIIKAGFADIFPLFDPPVELPNVAELVDRTHRPDEDDLNPGPSQRMKMEE